MHRGHFLSVYNRVSFSFSCFHESELRTEKNTTTENFSSLPSYNRRLFRDREHRRDRVRDTLVFFDIRASRSSEYEIFQAFTGLGMFIVGYNLRLNFHWIRTKHIRDDFLRFFVYFHMVRLRDKNLMYNLRKGILYLASLPTQVSLRVPAVSIFLMEKCYFRWRKEHRVSFPSIRYEPPS